MDSVIAEMDVCVNRDASLYLLQFPLVRGTRDWCASSDIRAKFKPHSEILELTATIDLDCGEYSRGRAQELGDNGMLDHVSVMSSLVPEKTLQMVGTVVGGRIWLVPVRSTLQLRPSFQHMNKSESSPEKPEEIEREIFQTQCKRRETKDEIETRLRSFSYCHKLANEEAWGDYAYSDVSEQRDLVDEMFLQVSRP